MHQGETYDMFQGVLDSELEARLIARRELPCLLLHVG